MGNSNSMHTEKAFRALLPTTSIKETLLAGHIWNIPLSTLPLWFDGTKFNPTLTFEQDATCANRLYDTAKYLNKNGKPEVLVATDTFVEIDKCPVHLLWRGTGLLTLISSDWYVVYISPKNVPNSNILPRFILTYFVATPVTPEGIEVFAPVSGGVIPKEELDAGIAATRERFPQLGKFLDDLKPLPPAPAASA